MRKLALYVIATAFAMPTLALHAQTSDKPAPGFTLTLSTASLGGSIPKTTQMLLVTYTNVSGDVDPGNTCAALGVFHKLVVVYNRVPVKESMEDERFNRWDETAGLIGS